MASEILPIGWRGRFAAWCEAELRPDVLGKSLITGVLLYSLQIMLVLSFGALIFSGPLITQLPTALGLIVVGDAVLCVVVTVLSSYGGSIAIAQDTSAVMLAAVAATITAVLPKTASPAEQFATVALMIVGTTVLTGLFFLLLGFFKLGGLVRFLPFPVMGGFLAGTGWLLFTGGIGVMVTIASPPDLLRAGMIIHWVPGMALGILMYVITSKVANTLVLPTICVVTIAIFYAVAWITHTSPSTLDTGGWLMGHFPSGNLWRFPLSASIVGQINWTTLIGQIPNMAPILLVSVISLLLNASGLELIVKKDMDLDRELIAAGVANIVAGAAGGLVGYHAISLSSLSQTMNGGRRLSGLVMAVLIGLTAFVGATVLGNIPRLLLGALLIYLGVALLYEWVYEAWTKFSHLDFGIIILILGIIAFYGFLPGIGVGLAAAIVLFVISYSRTSVVKHAMSGADYRSRVTRNPAQEAILNVRGHEIYILALQGYIFFGTANALLEEVQKRITDPTLPQVTMIVIDFTRVTGLDSTGLLSFRKLCQVTHDRLITVVMTGFSSRLANQMRQEGFDDDPSEDIRVFAHLDRGLEWCESQILAPSDPGKVAPINLQEQLVASGADQAGTQALISHMTRRTIAAGEYLIRQSDEPDMLFFIESGQVTAQLETPGAEPVRLETMQAGRVVGELGFYLGTRRTAAVIADEPGVIYQLSRHDLAHIEATDPTAAYALHRTILELLGQRVVHLINVVNALQR